MNWYSFSEILDSLCILYKTKKLLSYLGRITINEVRFRLKPFCLEEMMFRFQLP